jgi:hypothetical protein
MMHASLSRKILIALIVLFVLSFIDQRGMITAVTVLDPLSVIRSLELWRVITWPLSIGAGMFGSLLIAGICFGAPAEEVEQMLGTRRFGLLLLALTVGVALLHMLLFFGTGTILGGPLTIALFTLVGFVYLFPHSEVRIIFFSVRGWVLLTFIVATITLIGLLGWLNGGSPVGLLTDGGYGLVLGAIYFHIRFQKYPILLRPIRSVERMVAGGRSDTAWRATPSGRRASAPQPVRLRMPFQKSSPREISDEERLNSILDRINEKGYSDLSEEEKTFLREYSGRL